jgi:hypothetical protein
LAGEGRLPGVLKGDKGFPISPPNYDELASQNFPKSKTVEFHKESDSSVYHYHMVRTSAESEWKLTKAWRTSRDGKVIQEFPVP